MNLPFPEPTEPRGSRAEVFLGYLDYFRSVLVDKLQGLPDDELRASRLPSGWAPLALLKHLTYVELRWLVWGFEGEPRRGAMGRRTAGALVCAAGATLKEIMARIGHGSTRAVMIYQHATSERDRKIAEALDLMIQEARAAGEEAATDVSPPG